MATIKTTCSGCSTDVLLNRTNESVTVRVPSNGLRGSKHVGATVVHSDLGGDDDLLTWECPVCDYADSYDLHQ